MSFWDKETSIWYKIKKIFKKLKISSVIALITVFIFIYQTILTRKSFELANKNFYIDNSPYLLIHEIQYDHFITGDTITFKLKIKNYGKSPAFDVNISEIEIRDNPFYSYDSTVIIGLFVDTTQKKIIQNDILSDFFYTKSNSICDGNDYRYKNKYIAGKILYRDIFNRILYTRFNGLFKDDKFIPSGDLNKIGTEKEADQ